MVRGRGFGTSLTALAPGFRERDSGFLAFTAASDGESIQPEMRRMRMRSTIATYVIREDSAISDNSHVKSAHSLVDCLS